MNPVSYNNNWLIKIYSLLQWWHKYCVTNNNLFNLIYKIELISDTGEETKTLMFGDSEAIEETHMITFD